MSNSVRSSTTQSVIRFGSSLQGISNAQIANITGASRTGALEIRNYHSDLELVKPIHYLWSGVCCIPPSLAIKPGYSEACLYRHTRGSLFGTSGVLLYYIDHVVVDFQKSEIVSRESKGFRLVLMWSNPLFGATKHAVGISTTTLRPEVLYSEMVKRPEEWFPIENSNHNISYQSKAYDIEINVESCVSHTGRAVWTVNIQ